MNEFVKRLKLIELLKHHTDKDHPITQAKLREVLGENEKEILGYKNTFSRMLKDVADALNTDESGNLLPKEQWKIVYPKYQSKEGNVRNGKIYYNHPLSSDELLFLVQTVRSSIRFSDTDKDRMEAALQDAFASKYYRTGFSDVATNVFYSPHSNLVNDNLAIIRTAIDRKWMLECCICGVNADGTFYPKKKIRVSPYRIIEYKGGFWLLGSQQKELHLSPDITMYRIDRMNDITFARVEEGEYYDHYNKRVYRRLWGSDRIAKANRISGSGDKYYDEKSWDKYGCFTQEQDLRRAYIKNEDLFIYVKIKWGNTHRRDYSFLYDTFGATFREVDGMVEIKSTVEFFVDWAMTYADRIEIVEKSTASRKAKAALKKRLQKAMENVK